MWNLYTVYNETPYTFHYCSKGREGVHTVHGNSTGTYLHAFLPLWGLSFRYGNHSESDLTGHGGGASYTFRESRDGKEFELVHNMLGVVDRCPNFGKIDEEKKYHQRCQQEEQRRKQDEEKRRQAELERQTKIQEQIEKENETLRKHLSQAHNRLQLEQNFKAWEHYHQHSHVLHHLVEDHAHQIERDEVADVNEKFEELLSTYDIKEDENLNIPLEDRMKMLQNELTLQYFKKHSIPTLSQWALDQATGYVHLSLTERFNILEAVVEVTLEGCPDFEGVLTTGQDKMTEFLLSLQEELHAENPTLAKQVLANVLNLSPTLLWSGKEILSQILFNNIWTPKEIKLFIEQTLNMDQKIVTQILHKVCTYRLGSDGVLSALKEDNPVECIQHCVHKAERDKDADTILTEMKDKNYPEKILSLLREVLTYTEEVLPKLESVLTDGKMIEDCKRMITSLDFNNPEIGVLKKILIILSTAIKNCTTFTTQSGEQVQGYFPRLTQLASLLLLLLPQSEDETYCLLEISTGEGKTCILAMFATIQAIRGIKVDIVTSSPLLASRDQDEWKKLYDMFGITSSTVPPPQINNCSFKDHDKLLEDAYRQQVVYGTVGTFAADILRQEFEKKTTRGQRKFECVVVDEVDYMTLDSGVQVTYLSHQAGSLRHVEQVLASIWAMMSACRPIEIFETGKIKWGTRIHHFHKTVIQAVIGSESEGFSATDILMLGAQLGFYSQEDVDELNQAEGQPQTETDSFNAKWNAIEKIMAKIGPEEQRELLRKLEQINENSVSVDCYSLVNNKAKLYRKESSHRDPDVSLLLLENGRACEIMSEKSLVEGTVDKLKSTIKYSDQCSLKSLDEFKGFIVIPSFLKKYIENQLRVFVENALKAIRMTQGREYMIEKAPEADTGGLSDTDSHQYDAIIPVDFEASGVLEKNKRWGEGLQQFLEMKHQLTISQLSNVTNYMSNVHFFKRYLSGKGIFGVSGTLGGDAEKAFLEQHYKTASYVIPAHRHKKLVELPAVQVSGGGTQWIQVICETAQRAADRGQVVLIICEDVRTANELMTKVHDPERQANQITMYTISEKHNIEKQKFSQGNIIIATNLGGRGTDIHVQQEVNECGGLFVLLTYFPRSQRVERQVFGRTARKGNPGMVQMILNQDHLAPAYQGHSIETMRLLRDEYEVSRLDSMEKNELCEIEMKETLFTSFCQFLCDFDKNFTEEERSDLSKMKLKDVPECFKIHWNKFDYQTALNALKESWALWLILHEEPISRHDDISKLREDLTKDLKKTGDLLLQGTSNNFYDYIKQATSRTELQNMNKTECDFGAKTYLQNAVECDHLYSAVALYNHAYITLKLKEKGYITEAKKLLEEAQIAVDVYLSESANTMMFCNLSVSGFAPHHTNNNLQIQIQARMNIFKSWKGYIERALTALRQLNGSNDDAEVEDSSVYHLSKDRDFITTSELMILYDNGLGIFFEVKKKPKFSYDALACFLLGAFQVAAGVLVCALSCGGASHFGLGLICEGVSDIIKGIQGMIQGGFDWAEWAVSKAINIGLSLISGGFSRLRKAASLVRSGTKALITGTKTTVFTVKQCFWKAGMYAVQELGKQGCASALSYAVDKGINAFFQKVLREVFEKKVFSLMKANNELDKVLTNFICSGISKTALENGSSEFSIDNECEKQMRQSVELMTREVIPGLMMDCTKVLNVLATLSEVCSAVTQHIESQKLSRSMEDVLMCLKTATNFTVCVQILNSVPTEKVINNTFVPELLQIMEKLPQEENEQDGRHSLSHVKCLKDELINMIAESVSNAYVEACSRHMTSIMAKMCMSKINHAAGSAVSNILGRADTQEFFYNQEYKYDMKKAIKSPCESLSESEKKDLESYIGEIFDVNRPATALDIHVLTQSDALEGKGIKLVMVDKDGKKLSEDYFPGNYNSAGDIVLQLKKEPENPQQTGGFFSKLTKRIVGEQSPCSGHFEILTPDGTVIPVNSDGQNCLYYAVAQATCKNPGDIRKDAMVLRNEVKNTLQQNLHRYAGVLKLQKAYEETCKSAGKYYICGGDQKARKEAIKKFETIWDKTSKHSLSEDEIQQIQEQCLGLVGKHADVYRVRVEKAKQRGSNRNHPPVEADHVPPKCVFQNVLEKLQDPENVKLKETLKNKNPKLYAMLDQSGNRGLCREVLKSHHEAGLTWRNRKESRIISEKLEEILISGDGEKLVKMSLMAANPVVSNGLRKDAGIPDRQQAIPREMSDNATKRYHDAGDKLLVKGYYKMGIINKEGKHNIMKWLEEGQLYSMNTSEYKEICNYLNSKNNKNNNK